jgi:hypothetical protein
MQGQTLYLTTSNPKIKGGKFNNNKHKSAESRGSKYNELSQLDCHVISSNQKSSTVF